MMVRVPERNLGTRNLAAEGPGYCYRPVAGRRAEKKKKKMSLMFNYKNTLF